MKSKYYVFREYFNKNIKKRQKFSISSLSLQLRISYDAVRKYIKRAEKEEAISIKRDERGKITEIRKTRDL